MSSASNEVVLGLTCSEVRALLGEPNLAEDMTVPLGSAWGTQAAFVYQIPAGCAVRQWIYESDATDDTIWFALVDGEWRATLRLKLGRIYRQC